MGIYFEMLKCQKSKAILVFNNCRVKWCTFLGMVSWAEFLVFILRSDTSRQELVWCSYFFSLSQTYFTILDTHKDLHFRRDIKTVWQHKSNQLLAWGGQSTGVSALASVLPKNTQDWSPLEWTGWISLQSMGLSRVFSNTTAQKHQFFSTQLSSQSNSHIHTWPLEKP